MCNVSKALAGIKKQKNTDYNALKAFLSFLKKSFQKNTTHVPGKNPVYFSANPILKKQVKPEKPFV